MKFTTQFKPLDKIRTGVLVIFGFEDKASSEEKSIDKFFGSQIQKLRSSKDFSGAAGKTRLFFHSANLPRILLVGLGKPKEFTTEKLRGAASTAVSEFKKLPVEEAAILLPNLPRMDAEETATAITEALMLANYRFSYYKKPEEQTKLDNIHLVPAQKRAERAAAAGCLRGEIV